MLRKNKNNNVDIDEIIDSNLESAHYDEYDDDKYGIKKAIEALSGDHKLITVLYYYDEYSVTKISKIIEIPEGTVKSRLSTARKILKEKLEKEEI